MSNFSRDYRSCGAVQIVARRFQTHSSTFEKLSVELRGHVIPDLRPIASIRVPLELEAGLLDSGVLGLLGTEELAGNELTSNPQLNGYLDPISECRGVVRTHLLH